MRHDLTYALRLLRRSPLFTITAALSLAIGIGANTTIFSIATALLFRPLPGLADPSRLVDVGRTQDGRGFDTVSYPNFRDLRERTKTLVDIYAYRVEPAPMSLSVNGEAERIYGSSVTANYFAVLGARPQHGRLLQDSDDRPGGMHDVVVLSDELWRRKFSANPAIVGQTISLNSHPFRVVGVASRGFQGTTLLKMDVWTPITALAEAMPRLSGDLMNQRRSVWLVMGARLKPDVPLSQVAAELQTIGANLEREYPVENKGKNFIALPGSVFPGQTSSIGGFLGLLMAVVGLVLLIACVNVAGMLLARAAARRREIAVRLAIGADRRHLVRQLLTETLILFAAGGLLGVVLAQWFTAFLLALLPKLPVPVAIAFTIDWRVVSFATVLSLATAILSGLVPALQASRADLVSALKTEGREATPSRLRLRNAFLVGQVTLSLMLVIVAGLFLRALEHAAAIQPGFDERRVDVVQLDLTLGGYNQQTAGAFVRDLLDRIRALPAVESATLSVDLPLDGGRMGLGGLKAAGRTPARGDEFSADWNIVEPGLFTTLKLPLTRGRDFTEQDTATAPWVAIVNEALATQIWPGEDPIGKQVTVPYEAGRHTVTIVGVTANARLIWLTGNVSPYIYVPFAQRFLPRVALLVRTKDDRSAIPDVRTILRTLNPNLPITEAMRLADVTAVGLTPQRIAASVAGTLGIVGLLLCAVGIYGVTSYSVAQRTREIGIRVALGADGNSVMRLVLRQGLVVTAIGALIGLAVAAAGVKLIESLLFGVRGLDPITFGSTCALFVVVTLLASYLPARRASKVDPMVALRAE
jgi:predicted permease